MLEKTPGKVSTVLRNLKLQAVAIAQRRRGNHRNLGSREINLANMFQRIDQDFLFACQLMFIAHMLEVTSPAFSKVGTGCGYSLWGGFQHSDGLGTKIMSPIFKLLNKNSIPRYGKRHEGGTSLMKGQAAATWNDPFDVNCEWGFQLKNLTRIELVAPVSRFNDKKNLAFNSRAGKKGSNAALQTARRSFC